MELTMRVRRYLARTGMAQTVFGRAVLNDPRLVEDLVNGRRCGPRTAAKIDAFMATYPEGLR